MTKIYFSELTKDFTKKLFRALLDFAYSDDDRRDRAIACEWIETRKVKFKISKMQLQDLYGGTHNEDVFEKKIRPAIADYLPKVLGIVKGMKTRKDLREFELHLWADSKEENLEQFDHEWDSQAKASDQKASTSKRSKGIEWRSACKAQLERQKQQITSSPLHRKARNLDSVHVPLGLVERKERPKVDRAQEISPERGSAAEQQEYTEKRVEHDAFLAEIGKRQPGEHLVILGEPGAGKTTLLTKVWEWLLDHEQPGEDLIVAWVPLAAVKNNELEEYLHKSWIKQFCKTSEIDRYWESFEALADAGRVWLLLDGADEMGGEALRKLEVTLREAWTRSTRAIITCRLNLWDASSTNQLQTSPNFQVYRTLDFKYVNPARQDEVKSFIDNWFQSTEEPDAGQKLRAALDEVGKERIKDLAQNPLRLTLLCAIWGDDRALPETQAGLYELFVDYVYKWKATEFPVAVNLRGELDRALGDLAKQGINKPSLRFRFTEAELRKWVPVVEQCQALMDLGWLNCVGEENKRPVFSFFHPTFQEYFAACSIDDWDYFLPRAHVDQPVPCQNEEIPTYRVFKKQWQQVILFWIGRKFEDKRKEEFLIKITNFHDSTSDFYYYQAYFLAAICVGEFQLAQEAESIVQTIVKLAFGYFDHNEQAWVNLERVNDVLASNALILTQRQHLIKSLLPILFQEDLSDDEKLLMSSIHKRLHVISILGKIAKGNTKLIEELTSLIYKTDNDLLRISLAEALGSIDSGNHLAITLMINFICQPISCKYDVLFFVAQCLGRISIGNKTVINELLSMLYQLRDTDDSRQSIIVDTLSNIAAGDIETVNVLISMLQSNSYKSNSDLLLLHEITDALIQISLNNKNAINTINFKLLKTNQSQDLEAYISRILQEVNSGNKKEYISPYNIFLSPHMNFYYEREVLDTIEAGDEQAIKELTTTLLELKIDNPRLFLAAYTLGRVDIGNKLAITTLLAILSRSFLNDYSLCQVVHALKEIAVSDNDAISKLIDFISEPNLSNLLRYSAADALWHIDIGNETAINTLLDLLSKSWDDSLPMGTGEDFDTKITVENMLLVINKLKYQVTIDMCECNFKRFHICNKIIWKCAQLFPYHEFHTAWHQS
jgi:GTPase SAR1 family protein